MVKSTQHTVAKSPPKGAWAPIPRLLRHLADYGTPEHLNLSYLMTQAGFAKDYAQQVSDTFRALWLVDPDADNAPTEELRQLVQDERDGADEKWRELMERRYGLEYLKLLEGAFITREELKEEFAARWPAEGSSLVKGTGFSIQGALKAGFPVAPQLIPRNMAATTGGGAQSEETDVLYDSSSNGHNGHHQAATLRTESEASMLQPSSAEQSVPLAADAHPDTTDGLLSQMYQGILRAFGRDLPRSREGRQRWHTAHEAMAAFIDALATEDTERGQHD